MALFTSRADLNVGIVNEYILNSRGPIENNGQTAIDFYDPSAGLPALPDQGDRYISLATANGWIIDDIEQYDEDTDTWKNITPIPGAIVWLETPGYFRIWNTVAWVTPSIAFGGTGTAVITTSQVWAIPVSATQFRFTMWGAGGGGAGASNDTGGGGGACGAFIPGFEFYYTAGGNITVTIGAGGAGGVGLSNGTAGGDSIVTIGGFTLTAYGGGPGNLNGMGGSGGGAGSAGTATTPGDSSSNFPIQGPFGAYGGAASSGATNAGDGVEGDASYCKVISGSAGGGGCSLGTGNGGSGGNFMMYSGGAGGISGGALESSSGGGAAGPGGNGPDGVNSGVASANGINAAANSGAGGSGGAASFGFAATGGDGGSGLVIIEYM